MTLDNLPIGKTASVDGFSSESNAQISQFIALGIVPEAQIQVLNVAFLGCPLQVKVGQSLLSIRKIEAALINIQELNGL